MPKTKWVVMKSPQLIISLKLITVNFENDFKREERPQMFPKPAYTVPNGSE